MSLNVIYYVLAASFLFIIGAYCLATRKSIIKQVIGLEIMVNAAHLSFVALSSKAGNGVIDPYAMSFIIISLGVGATVVALALLLTVQVYRVYRTTDVTELKRLRR
ncbi:MAG: NADH-quinone oxidoreductase subunit NuoK [Aigarchaeota archaeon]|jgi:NADH:ubiquinone oxidoreductase subunit K|nr:NADH-quinone oxidoreductase subunit NuoK [Candidatus Caldarchaeales archaeon]